MKKKEKDKLKELSKKELIDLVEHYKDMYDALDKYLEKKYDDYA